MDGMIRYGRAWYYSAGSAMLGDVNRMNGF